MPTRLPGAPSQSLQLTARGYHGRQRGREQGCRSSNEPSAREVSLACGRELRTKGRSNTGATVRLTVLIAALACLIGSGAAFARLRATDSTVERSSRLDADDTLLRARCLGSRRSASSPVSTVRLRETEHAPWGFFLAGSSAGFQPGEPVLTLVFEPRWRTPACLENANASQGGIAESTAAFWYRAAISGPYRLCLVGVGSGRVACGSLTVRVRTAGVAVL